jgi:hypothetical protein
MPRLANIERMKVITRYNEISGLRLRNPFKKVSETIKVERINISERGVRNIIAKWLKTSMICYFFIVSIQKNHYNLY